MVLSPTKTEQGITWVQANPEEFVAGLKDPGKAALLHALMKHYTGPTEGLLSSLRQRMEEMQGMLSPPDLDMHREQAANVLNIDRSRREQETYDFAVHGLATLGYDLTVMMEHATRAITFSMEVVANLTLRKMGHTDVSPKAVPPATAACPPVPASRGAAVSPPECPASPIPVRPPEAEPDPKESCDETEKLPSSDQ